MRLLAPASLALPLALIATAASAQEPAPVAAEDAVAGEAPDREAESDAAARREIVVEAPRLPGQIEASQPPIVTLDQEDIAAYGASNLSDLIAALAPQTGSGRGRGDGRPVILFNGQRISNFREFRNIPPEAIRRVEVLPEEVALRFGYPANQRVINFILRDNFASRSFDVEYEMPDRGGFATSEFEATLLRISKTGRFNLNLQLNDSTMLTEAERGVIQQAGSIPTVATDPDPAEFRSLVADSRSVALTGSWARGLGENGRGGSFSVNANLARNDSRSLSGLDTVLLTAPGGATALRSLPDPLERTTRSNAAAAGAALNLRLGKWQFSATLDATHGETRTYTDRRADTAALVTAAAAGTLAIAGPLPSLVPAGRDLAVNNSERVESLLTLIGSPLRLPAGELSATLKAGLTWIDFASSDQRAATGPVALRRFRVLGGVNLGIPLTSRRENFGGAIGDVTLNLGATVSDVSDVGSVNDWNAGLIWAPTEKLSLQASYLVNQESPTISQLGNPQTLTFNVPVYDLSRGETVLVTITGGGNPLLRREQQRDLKFGANWTLPFLRNSSLLVEYFRNRSNDVTSEFPVLTPEIEAAFPDRVTRDGAGRLTAIDRRPVTLAETEGERLRWGLNVSGTIGKAPAGPGGPGAGAPGPGRPGSGPPGGPGGGRGPGGGGGGGLGGPMMGMFGGGGPGRWNLSVYHTWRFAETVLVAPGGPVLDLLGGDALTGGGVPRHALEFEGGAFHKGFGLRVNGGWTAPTTIRASGAPGTSDLRFGALLKLDLRTFVDFGQQKKLVGAVPFLKGARLSFVVENLFDQRQRVTDAGGTVPLSYQPDYLDPKGRFLGIDFRKVF